MLFVALMSGPTSAAPRDDVLQLASGSRPTYVNSYLQNPQVSGNLLVGVRWASAKEKSQSSARFDPKNVRLVVPAGLQATSACVDIVSKDGRYMAENLYAIPPDTAREPRLSAPTKYEKVLKEYSIDNVAVMIL